MKGCHYCAGERMLVKATILQPDGKPPIVLVQCPRCARIEQDTDA